MESDDGYDLARFTAAQDPVFDTVLDELRKGSKQTHWMWFVFPQLRGLGRSPTAIFYGIGSISEARAYLDHGVLGKRLRHATRTVLGVEGLSAHEIFGSPDDLKFRSSMTLFSEAAGAGGSEFQAALKRYFDGKPDDRTLALLREADSG